MKKDLNKQLSDKIIDLIFEKCDQASVITAYINSIYSYIIVDIRI